MLPHQKLSEREKSNFNQYPNHGIIQNGMYSFQKCPIDDQKSLSVNLEFQYINLDGKFSNLKTNTAKLLWNFFFKEIKKKYQSFQFFFIYVTADAV